ncbi:MAG: hypothetical protein HY815_04715 [Candidatus Riflebacteria bacterium]|nr:hypothetical protein [Candidatus Riflebacteria bacterium]
MNQQALLSVIDLDTQVQVPGSSCNLNRAASGDRYPPYLPTQGLLFNTPWGMAIAPGGTAGYILSAGSNLAVRATLDATGNVTVAGHVSPYQSSNGIIRVAVGKNPRAIVFEPRGRFAYVHNHIGRTVSVIDLLTDQITDTAQAADPPVTGSLEASIVHGEELFNTSIGTSTQDGSTGRMSESGWASCFGCHPFGWTDTAVWSFPSGPRKSIPLFTTVSRSDPGDHRMMTWSAICDEVADFEQKIRTVCSTVSTTETAPRQGLMVGIPGSDIQPFVPKANTNRSTDWDDLENYLRRGVRAPISPLRGSVDPDIPLGNQLFAKAGCNTCHGGSKWTVSRRIYTPPPYLGPSSTMTLSSQGEFIEALRPVDTFFALERTATNRVALGANGFNPPSLLGAWAFPPYFHNGQATTLEEVLIRPVVGAAQHKDAGVPGQLESEVDRARLIRFLESIDDATPTY